MGLVLSMVGWEEEESLASIYGIESRRFFSSFWVS